MQLIHDCHDVQQRSVTCNFFSCKFQSSYASLLNVPTRFHNEIYSVATTNYESQHLFDKFYRD